MTLLTLLLRLEWAGDRTHYVCPLCHVNRMHGHTPDCALEAAIRRYTLTEEVATDVTPIRAATE